MKKLIVITIAFLFTLSLHAQPAGYHRIYNEYKGEEGVVAIHVPGIVLKFAGAVADLDRQEKQLLRCLRSVSVLTIEEEHLYPGVNFAKEMDLSRMQGEYGLLLEVHEDGEDVIIAAREKRGRITDLIVIVGGSDNVLVHVRGRMHSDLLENLGEVAGIDELHLTARI